MGERQYSQYGVGGKVCTEREAVIFGHFIAVVLIVKSGQRTRNSIFVTILVLHLALTWMGGWSRQLCPSLPPGRAPGRLAQGAGDREGGEGGRDGGGGCPLTRKQRCLPLAKRWHRLAPAFGVGRARHLSPGFYLKGWGSGLGSAGPCS